ncbi:sodium:solute symporter family transporter [Methanolapillus millepedarum]|uniref:Sodium/glucose cotransporter n=1 Tax=Methanolapillus millepedarum TaxID=3028296 RepID=A0AA96ZVW8_9EURY|nr:Sodium/glucose cotransporter [Methanosarcinaceae archaeon Ac7]
MEIGIEVIVIALYLILMLVVGFLTQKVGTSSSKGYLVANRNVGALLIGGTIFATFWGGGTVMGGAGAAYTSYNLGTVADPWASGVTLIIMAIFMVPILLSMKIGTLGEMYRIRFGKRGAYVASILSVPTLIAWTAVQMVAIGKMLSLFIGMSPALSMILAGGIVIIYTYMGGMLAVIWTDNIQAAIIILGLMVLIPSSVCYIAAGGNSDFTVNLDNLVSGLSIVKDNTPNDFWTLFPSSDPDHPSGITRTLKGFLVWMAAWCGMGLGSLASLDITQRVLCARDENAARGGLLTGSALYWVAGLGPIFIGLLGIVMTQLGIFSSIEIGILSNDAEVLVPLLAQKLLHPLPMAIFVGSLMAAIMSTSSSTIFASAAVISTVLFPGSVGNKDSSESILNDKKAIRMTKFLVVIIGVFCIGISFLAVNLYDLMIFGFTLLFACLFWVVVCGLFWKKANIPGGIASMIVGISFSILGCIYLSVQAGTIVIVPDDSTWEIYFTFVPWIFSGLAMFIVSMLTQKSHPPLPLTDSDGKVLKWPELEVNLEKERSEL